MDTPLEILNSYYGYSSFRPIQEEIIQAVLAKRDTLALLPTGGGKSICYQVPALCMDGICLVITPLIALMKDQVMQLRRKNIPALALYSGMTFYEVKKTMQNATTGHFKFLFVSPERLQTRVFIEYFLAIPINLVAVDEAHCISQWGYDFRPSYLRIAELRKDMEPDVPILALTATATPEVQKDICEKLLMKQPAKFTQSFARPNLSFSVIETPHKLNKLHDILIKVPGSALVYCRNRRLTKEIASWLQMRGISACYYHAGLSNEERTLRQESWIRSQTRVMVCTNAFGMGIDKSDVRTVVHIGAPDSLEDYYQEAGRAGRDGKRSYAVLLFNIEELNALEAGVEKKFPTLDVISYYYQSIANYLQLPVGSGEGQYFDFDLFQFCDRFKVEPVATLNVLTILAAEGYISFNESVFIPSKVGFVCSKDYLFLFQEENPSLEPLIKSLLRTYEGIFDNEVNINERKIARILNVETDDIVKQLNTLNFYKIIHYVPKKDTPQIFFLYNRIPASQVIIDLKVYKERKKRQLQRAKAMIGYALGSRCRSLMIQEYLGENEVATCGICDDCLSKHVKQKIKHTEILQWIKETKELLKAGPLETDKICKHLGLTRYQADQMINYGLSEKVFNYDHQARIYLIGV